MRTQRITRKDDQEVVKYWNWNIRPAKTNCKTETRPEDDQYTKQKFRLDKVTNKWHVDEILEEDHKHKKGTRDKEQGIWKQKLKRGFV